MMQPSPNISYEQLAHLFMDEGITLGKRLVIAAEAAKGQMYQPTPVTSVDQAKMIFGSGPLIDRCDDATAFANFDVYLMRMDRNAFQYLYRCLMPFPFDLIYIDGFTFNKMPDEIQDFIDFAKQKEYHGQLIHGFFDIEGLSGFEAYRSLFVSIAKLSIVTEDGIEETGKYISVVVDQIKDRKAAAVYAGLVTALKIGASPINKALADVDLKAEFTNDQIIELRSAGMVCFRKSFKKGTICTSATCAVATEGSVHKNISNFRIAQDVIQEIAQIQQEYVGRVGISFVKSELEDQIEVALMYRMKLGQLRRYDYELTTDELNGIINTAIELVPIFTIQKMNASALVRVRV
ncbi:hypothetical protein GZH47_32725 (plasmid) [Paenibacillus rhizovicinus]|uniref:Uncharacterized protein n=1 Tax=Paenibacillus rhizovicinus TaxID=2704463 RepID=A0A6C0PAR0_9BACL|nr:hypothetical protein [Paenibacillus rhizovicinus]QHW35664.1 hypothetical protein GZH47_32725 [Paenibacillus rhizovicinus]